MCSTVEIDELRVEMSEFYAPRRHTFLRQETNSKQSLSSIETVTKTLRSIRTWMSAWRKVFTRHYVNFRQKNSATSHFNYKSQTDGTIFVPFAASFDTLFSLANGSDVNRSVETSSVLVSWKVGGILTSKLTKM